MTTSSCDESVEIPDEDTVRVRAAELGISVELLLAAVHRGQSASDFCTESHPKAYPGMAAYAETNAGVRESTALIGWSFDDSDNIPRTVSPDGSVIITALSGNGDTGLREGKHVSTRRPRGAASVRILRRNGQLELGEALLPAEERKPHGEGNAELGPTWYLLFNRDGDVVRSELSLARAVDDGGALLEWSERLILPELNMNDAPPTEGIRPVQDEDIIDVPVQRRA